MPINHKYLSCKVLIWLQIQLCIAVLCHVECTCCIYTSDVSYVLTNICDWILKTGLITLDMKLDFSQRNEALRMYNLIPQS